MLLLELAASTSPPELCGSGITDSLVNQFPTNLVGKMAYLIKGVLHCQIQKHPLVECTITFTPGY